MPKTEIDYSNTIIYKITCKNQAITDVYVGHTTNFVQRKHSHKQNCINSKSANHKCKVYEVIRANGGWANWRMEIINFFNCADHYEARKREQEYFIELKANLNSIEPFPKPKNKPEPKLKVEHENKIISVKPTMHCTSCNIYFNNLNIFNKHNNTNKHKNGGIVKSKVKISQNSPTFTCDICDYATSNKKDYKKHVDTIKHKTLSNPNDTQFKKTPPVYQCKCGKIYKHAPTLSAHKKKCNYKVCESKPTPAQYIKNDPSEQVHSMDFLTNLVIEVVKNNAELQKQNQEILKQNQEFQKQMLEVCKSGTTNNNIHNNSHNKTFNLQFFLNETCKDAMNIMDFVNTMTLEFSDLEEVGKIGYVEGISNIIIRKLNALDVHKRPIHCSDAKREIMYVKDENIWEKENSTYDKLRKAIKHVTCKNSAMLEPWSKAHPQCMNTSHRLNDVYVQMIGQSMGGKESFVESENKIMKRIAKAVLIEK